DVATFGCVLLHLHNPFLALANVLRLTKETVIVTQPLHGFPWEGTLLLSPDQPHLRLAGGLTWAPDTRPWYRRAFSPIKRLLGSYYPRLRYLAARVLLGPGCDLGSVPCAVFVPNAKAGQPIDTWWFLTPAAVQQILAVLGFEDSQVSYHMQRH